jgi:hypothetical protein
VAPLSIRFERFTVFHTSGSAGGHDLANKNKALAEIKKINYKVVIFPRKMTPHLPKFDQDIGKSTLIKASS